MKLLHLNVRWRKPTSMLLCRLCFLFLFWEQYIQSAPVAHPTQNSCQTHVWQKLALQAAENPGRCVPWPEWGRMRCIQNKHRCICLIQYCILTHFFPNNKDRKKKDKQASTYRSLPLFWQTLTQSLWWINQSFHALSSGRPCYSLLWQHSRSSPTLLLFLQSHIRPFLVPSVLQRTSTRVNIQVHLRLEMWGLQCAKWPRRRWKLSKMWALTKGWVCVWRRQDLICFMVIREEVMALWNKTVTVIQMVWLTWI